MFTSCVEKKKENTIEPTFFTVQTYITIFKVLLRALWVMFDDKGGGDSAKSHMIIHSLIECLNKTATIISTFIHINFIMLGGRGNAQTYTT